METQRFPTGLLWSTSYLKEKSLLFKMRTWGNFKFSLYSEFSKFLFIPLNFLSSSPSDSLGGLSFSNTNWKKEENLNNPNLQRTERTCFQFHHHILLQTEALKIFLTGFSSLRTMSFWWWGTIQAHNPPQKVQLLFRMSKEFQMGIKYQAKRWWAQFDPNVFICFQFAMDIKYRDWSQKLSEHQNWSPHHKLLLS